MLTRGGSGLLVCANNDRKLDVKVGIKMVKIISNYMEQGLMSLDMQDMKCIYFLLKVKPFLPKIKIMCMQCIRYLLNIYSFLQFDKCCPHFVTGPHPRETGNLQSSLCTARSSKESRENKRWFKFVKFSSSSFFFSLFSKKFLSHWNLLVLFLYVKLQNLGFAFWWDMKEEKQVIHMQLQGVFFIVYRKFRYMARNLVQYIPYWWAIELPCVTWQTSPGKG